MPTSRAPSRARRRRARSPRRAETTNAGGDDERRYPLPAREAMSSRRRPARGLAFATENLVARFTTPTLIPAGPIALRSGAPARRPAAHRPPPVAAPGTPVAYGPDLGAAAVHALAAGAARAEAGGAGGTADRHVRGPRVDLDHPVRRARPAAALHAALPLDLALPGAQRPDLRDRRRAAGNLVSQPRRGQRAGGRSRTARLSTAVLPRPRADRASARADQLSQLLGVPQSPTRRAARRVRADRTAPPGPPGHARALPRRALLPLRARRRAPPAPRRHPSPALATSTGSGDDPRQHDDRSVRDRAPCGATAAALRAAPGRRHLAARAGRRALAPVEHDPDRCLHAGLIG